MKHSWIAQRIPVILLHFCLCGLLTPQLSPAAPPTLTITVPTADQAFATAQVPLTWTIGTPPNFIYFVLVDKLDPGTGAVIQSAESIGLSRLIPQSSAMAVSLIPTLWISR